MRIAAKLEGIERLIRDEDDEEDGTELRDRIALRKAERREFLEREVRRRRRLRRLSLGLLGRG